MYNTLVMTIRRYETLILDTSTVCRVLCFRSNLKSAISSSIWVIVYRVLHDTAYCNHYITANPLGLLRRNFSRGIGPGHGKSVHTVSRGTISV